MGTCFVAILLMVYFGRPPPPSQVTCIIALAYLELAASALGLDACWGGYFGAAAASFPPLQKALSLPDGHLTFGVMMVGGPRMTYQRLPARNAAKVS
jgi:nitroreductase